MDPPDFLLFSNLDQNILDPLDQYLEEIMPINEKQQLHEICIHFRSMKRMNLDDYYSFFEAILNFCTEKDDNKNIIRCSISGIIPVKSKVKFKDEEGDIVLLNSKQIAKLLNKSKKAIIESFFEKMAIELSFEDLKIILSKNSEVLNKTIAYNKIISGMGYQNIFYFIKTPSFQFNHFNLTIFNPTGNDNHQKSLYLLAKAYYLMHSEERKLLIEKQKILDNVKKIAFQLAELVKKMLVDNMRQITNSSNDNDNSTEKNAINNLEKDKLISYIESQIKEIDQLISEEKRSKSLGQKQEYLPITLHKKRTPWNNPNLFKFGFLIQYCSSSAYDRLYTLVKQQIPPISTINSHYKKDILNKKNILSNSNEIASLLDNYWTNSYDTVANYISDFNEKYNANLNIDDFKIDLVLGSDAASFTRFNSKYEKQNKQKGKNLSITEKEKIKLMRKIDRENRRRIFIDLINGNFETIEKPNNILDDKDVNYFFTYTLQPFNWKLPIIVVHLEKSLTGHFNQNDAMNIKIIINEINKHKHFRCHFFAADGDKSLDIFHEEAFKKYEAELIKYIKKEITLDTFINRVEQLCYILPVLDLFHGTKIGRDKIMDSTIRLGENTELINAQSLIESLGIDNKVTRDDSTLGKMNDNYVLVLFSFENVMIEFKKQLYSSGLYIMFYSLFLELYRNPFMNLQFRTFLAKFLLSLSVLFYKGTSSLPTKTGLQNNSKSDNEYVWFDSKVGCIQLMNTLIGLCIILKNPHLVYYFGFERYSSHPDEQYFGRYRNHFIGFSTPETAFNFAVRSSLALDFEHDLNVTFKIPKRENFGGVHLDFHDSHGLVFNIFSPPLIDLYYKFDDFAVKLYNIGTGIEKFDDSAQHFIQMLYHFFFCFPSVKSNRFSKTKGASVVPRLIAASENVSMNEHRTFNIFELYNDKMLNEEENTEQAMNHNILTQSFESSIDNSDRYEEEEEEEYNEKQHNKK